MYLTEYIQMVYVASLFALLNMIFNPFILAPDILSFEFIQMYACISKGYFLIAWLSSNNFLVFMEQIMSVVFIHVPQNSMWPAQQYLSELQEQYHVTSQLVS